MSMPFRPQADVCLAHAPVILTRKKSKLSAILKELDVQNNVVLLDVAVEDSKEPRSAMIAADVLTVFTGRYISSRLGIDLGLG